MTISPAANSRLAQWRVTWLIEHSTSHQLFWCIDSFVSRNPPERKALTLAATPRDVETNTQINKMMTLMHGK